MKNKTALGIGLAALAVTIGFGVVACDTTSKHDVVKVERTIEVPIQREMPDDATIPDYYVNEIDNE
jgi:hypothetical protein